MNGDGQFEDDLRTLTVDATADLLAVHPETVRRWIRDGRLEAMRWGGAFRIRRGAIRAFQEAARFKPRDPAAEARTRLKELRKQGARA